MTDSFFATTAEHVSVNRESVTSLSSDTSAVYNIIIEYDINAALAAAVVKMPYVADGNDPHNVEGSIVNNLATQTDELEAFLNTLKTSWAATKFAPANAGGTNVDGTANASTSLGAQVRNHLAILFDKSNLNQILGLSRTPAVVYDSNGRPIGDASPSNQVTGISATAYLDQTKINTLLNNLASDFSLKLMSMVQLKQVLDGVADSGRKRGVDGEGKPKYAFATGDSINSVVIVHDSDAEGLATPINNQDKWIFTIQQS
jgi:hypothetical protein